MALKTDASKRARGFVVFLHDPADALFRARVEGLAKKEGLEIPLCICDAGEAVPDGYTVPDGAHAVVITYVKKKVVTSAAWREGEIDAAAIDGVGKAVEALGEKK